MASMTVSRNSDIHDLSERHEECLLFQQAVILDRIDSHTQVATNPLKDYMATTRVRQQVSGAIIPQSVDC